MYWLNKLVWFFVNPTVIVFALGVFGAVAIRFGGRRMRRWGWGSLVAGLALTWFFSTFAAVALLGLPLERPYLATQRVESLPEADAIVLLGGGISKAGPFAYPDMHEGADRIWHAARLWKAGKAPVIVVSGRGDEDAAVPLLVDLGVPREKIVVDNISRNTYENSRFTERLILERSGDPVRVGGQPSVLLVTSAWHMPRASGNFARTSLRAIPAAADFTIANLRDSAGWSCWVLPGPGNFDTVCYLAKEWLGRLARR